MATYNLPGGKVYDDKTGATSSPGSSVQPAVTPATGQASYSTSQRGNAAPTVNFAPGMYYGKQVNTPQEFLAQDNPATRSSVGVNELAQPNAMATQQAAPTTPMPAPTDQSVVPKTREEAVAFLQQQGYNNPDDMEIAGAMSQSGTIGEAENIYKKSFQNIKASGLPMTDNAGEASRVIQQQVKAGKTQDAAPSQMTVASELDPSIEKNFPEYDQFQSPTNQRQSLVQEYEQLSSKLGLEKINLELINAKRVIEGTEDDIRSEVEKAGGFASDSQVQALANSRNKSLIKNYNYLLDMRNNVTTQLSTLMDLTIQDRKMASDEFDRKMNYTFKVAEFKRLAINDAKETTNNLIKNIGYDGLLSSLGNNPSAIARTEKLMGMQPGGIAQAAQISARTRAMEVQKSNLQMDVLRSNLETDKYQRAKISSEIDKINNEGKIVTDDIGKIVVNNSEALKINKELVSNDAYKAMQKGKDSLQYLNNFEKTFNQTGATSAVFSPRENARLKAEYNTAILNLKEFFNLGVLNGPDEEILKGVLPDPTNRSAVLPWATLGIYSPSAGTRSGLSSMKKMIETSLDDKFTSLTNQYGAYSSQSITSLGDLGRQYIEQKLILNPEGFDITVNGSVGHVNPDGTVTPK